MDLKEIYSQLTNINIDEQKLLWDERGKGYYGEYLVFCELYKQVPGACKILMNLNIPIENNKTTEIDLVMIHETGIYVFEVKHYKGTIYGKDSDNIWTQYFRTTKNNTFKNSMLQNDYHIKAIKKLFPDIPIKSIIVFTSRDCEIKVSNKNDNIDLCTLRNMNQTLSYRFAEKKKSLTMEEIDTIFEKMSKYSQMQEKIIFEGTENSFISWVQPTISALEQKKDELDIEKNNLIVESKKLSKTKNIGIVINILITIVCIIFAVSSANTIKKNYDAKLFNIKSNYDDKLTSIKNNYDTELNKFKQNFLHVDEIENQYIDAVNDYVDVSNISLVQLSNNAVSFTARLTISNDVYGIALSENSKYIVMTNSGKIYEYDVFGEHLDYSYYANRLGKGIRTYGDLAKIQFFGVNKNDISYIKITNIELFKLDANRTKVKDELELELYKK